MAYYLTAPDGRELPYSTKDAAMSALNRALKKYPDWKRSDFSLSEDEAPVLNPKAENEAMQNEIAAARKQALREDNPILSRLFPSSMMADVEGRSTWSQGKANVKDGASIIGRGIGAWIDATFNTPYGTKAKDVFVDSFGTPYDESPELVGERSFLGNLIQNGIKDPFLIPSMAVPFARLPWIAKTASPLLRAAMLGFSGSTAAEVARPLMIDDGINAKEATKNIVLGTVIPVALHGAKAGARGVERKVRGDYGKALSKYAELNNVEPDALNLLSTPEGRAGLSANFRQEQDITERELLGLAGFSDERFPEYAQFGDFLQREAQSAPDVATDGMAELMTGYEKRKTAAGGGLTSEEKATAASLKSDSDIFFNRTKKNPEPPPLILDQYGKSIVREPAKETARKMNAAQLNDARKRIGSLLDDEWKKMSAGRPDDEVKVLKDVYSGLRAKMLEVAERKGETAALEAYAKIAQKLAARDKLFDLAKIGSNKFRAQQNGERAVVNAWNSKNADHRLLQEAFKAADLAFGTKLYSRSRYASHAKNLAGKIPEGKGFEPSGSTKWFNGRGKQEFIDNLRGRTVKSAGEKLARIRELQLPTGVGRQGFGWLGYGVPAPEIERMGILGEMAQDDRDRDRYGFMLGR